MPVRRLIPVDHEQWAGRFYAAAELSRRKYNITMTFGDRGLMGMHASLSSKKFKIISIVQTKEEPWKISSYVSSDETYIFIQIPKSTSKSPRYFIVAGNHLKKLVPKRSSGSFKQDLKDALDDKPLLIPFSDIEIFENRWQDLPAPERD